MDAKQIMKIFEDTAYVRMGGTVEELKAAEYLKAKCAELGLNAEIVPFDVDMATIQEAKLLVDGQEITCKGYFNAGNAELEAPFYYLRSTDKYSLSQCKGKIVMVDGYMGYWMYQDLLENGAVGFITYDGNVNYADRDIDQRELRSHVHKGNKIPGVNINAKDAVKLISAGAKTAKIILRQHEYVGQSHNVVVDMPGLVDEYIAFTAHYDSTSLSQGAYDNMSGSVGILGIAEHFAKNPHRYGLRFIWCGSEERGLLGAKAYCANEENLKNCALNINLDMIGCIMGKFIACATAEEKLVGYIEYVGMENGMAVAARQGVYSSDSTPFADKGVPAISFARLAPPPTGTIHNSYDTIALMSGEQMAEDIRFLVAFSDRMANAVRMPVAKEIPENMKEKLDEYLTRKRPKK
ncbi:MAG: M28 family peptidase [Ruminococcaceae bacterium]|nr:M28 family peptidase [Oscillospiraceae bacterium]MBE6980584.1 M28 family peptidase [Oscillospiraceae bacterium]